jgi:hypothetical protein
VVENHHRTTVTPLSASEQQKFSEAGTPHTVEPAAADSRSGSYHAMIEICCGPTIIGSAAVHVPNCDEATTTNGKPEALQLAGMPELQLPSADLVASRDDTRAPLRPALRSYRRR